MNLSKFINPKGRLNRQSYFIFCFILLLSAIIVGSISKNHLLTFFILLLYACFILQTIKRLHDLNMAGWWAFLLFIPLVNLLAGAYVLVKKGSPGPNNYPY